MQLCQWSHSENSDKKKPHRSDSIFMVKQLFTVSQFFCLCLLPASEISTRGFTDKLAPKKIIRKGKQKVHIVNSKTNPERVFPSSCRWQGQERRCPAGKQFLH